MLTPNVSVRRSRLSPAGLDRKRALHERWFAVHCHAHRESGAAENLGRQGFPAFLPRRAKVRCHARGADHTLVPFSPGYPFVRLDLTIDLWRSVNSTADVVHLVMRGEDPAPAPRGIVEDLIAACDENKVIAWRADLVPGQPVRVLDGPCAGLVGQLDRLTGASRVRVLLDILGGQTPAFIPATT